MEKMKGRELAEQILEMQKHTQDYGERLKHLLDEFSKKTKTDEGYVEVDRKLWEMLNVFLKDFEEQMKEIEFGLNVIGETLKV